jgi:nucleotide-binding universal stress UspA family protein
MQFQKEEHMYKKILVALDGSRLAECVLPHVQTLVQGCQVRDVVFMRVVEPIKPVVSSEGMLTPQDAERITESMVSEAEMYLKPLVQGFNYDGAKAAWQVKKGPVAQTLVDYATEHAVDLIVIATHGRSGVSRWVWGSVADRVLRASCVPVLMVRAPGCVPGV